jgi:hypothetical protein
LSRIKSEYEALLIGFVNLERDGFDLNPSSTRVLAADDVLLVISSNADALAAHAVG